MSRYLIKETKVDNGFPGVSILTVTLQIRHYLFYHTKRLNFKENLTDSFRNGVNSKANCTHKIYAHVTIRIIILSC